MYNRRRIPLSGTENTRDLGGYPIQSSGFTQYGIFLRSGVPHGLHGEDEKMLQEMGIRTIIDLRSEAECMRTPCHFSHLENFFYHLLPISGSEKMMEGEKYIPSAYFSMTKCPNMPKIFKILATMEGGCLYHCTAGKDRTGTVSAILLLLAGVDTPDIVSDYCISYPYLSRLIASLKSNNADLPAYLGRSNPEYISEFLEAFLREYGSAESYLTMIGLTPQDIDSLKLKLICTI